MPSIYIRINPNIATIKEQFNFNKKYNNIYNNYTKNSIVLSKKSAVSIRFVALRSQGKLKKMLERLAKLVEEIAKNNLSTK